MKITKRVIFSMMLVVGCSSQPDEQQLKEEVLKTDRDFSSMSEEQGMTKAFLYYADEKVIKPNANQYPVIGKYELMRYFEKNPTTDFKLSWEPLKAEVSGTLAYTFGGYRLATRTSDNLRDTIYYGNYVSIWKRKKDGSWRFVFDTGNPTPGPVQLH